MARSVGVSQAQIIDAAANLADQYGLETLTLAQVAQAVGIRLPSLYNHVDGLAGLRYELAVLGTRELGMVIGRAAIGKSGDAAVLALAQAYRSYMLEHPGRYTASIRAPQPDDYLLQDLKEQIVTIVQTIMTYYQLNEEHSLHAIRGLRSIIHGFATLEQLGGFGLPLDREKSFRLLLEMYIAGLHVYQP